MDRMYPEQLERRKYGGNSGKQNDKAWTHKSYKWGVKMELRGPHNDTFIYNTNLLT